jgi:hypothetical protein
MARQINAPNTSIKFFPDARLDYRAADGDRLQIMKLTYRLEGTEFVSNQPTAGDAELRASGRQASLFRSLS